MDQTQTPPDLPASESKMGGARILYILYFLSFVVPLLGIGVIIAAYVMRGKDPVADTHFRHIIRTFWLSLLFLVISGLLTMVLIGYLLIIVFVIWSLVRMITGFILAGDGKPISGTARLGFVAK